MFIVMHCGGIKFNGDTIKTQSLGGSESAAYYVARELVSQGHSVTLFTNSEDTGLFDGVKYEWAGHITEDNPLGDRFTYYAENTPHDVCIIQRHPRAFERKYASKMNFWWVHDLALYRSKDIVIGQMWNVDGVLCVSEYHKEQIAKVYGIEKDFIHVIKNGVDLSLYGCEPLALPANERHIFYSSRPERGLMNFVMAGGIMDQLKDENIHLHVCGYENTTAEMAPMYNALWERCEDLPNVTNHGALTKKELAALQCACEAWVYPTEFEEVSCITAMEAMAANCKIIASNCAALPETCADTEAHLVALQDGKVNPKMFADTIRLMAAFKRNGEFAAQYSWPNVATRLIDVTKQIFSTKNRLSLAHHFIRHSDIPAFEALGMIDTSSPFQSSLENEFEQGYAFYRDDTYEQHYKNYYQYEKDRGIEYGAEDVTGTTRFRSVANMVAQLPSGSRVLDYGCAHGHYTVALARMFPSLFFVGADITQSNIDTAIAWAAKEDLTNITFQKVSGVDDIKPEFDLIIAAEVIEHVGNPQDYIDTLADSLAVTGKMVLTTPYGAWEAQGYREHGFWRAHLHHFERADLFEMLGHHPDYKIIAAPSGLSKFHSALGSYIVSFSKPVGHSMPINYQRKIEQTMPDNTVSCCMIVKDGEADLLRCLRSVAPYVQEIIIGVDDTTTDGTFSVIESFNLENPLVQAYSFSIVSPIKQGFAAARNQTIAKASCDWILWIDSDEILVRGDVMSRFLRHSMYNGFAVRQHHFSHDPTAIIKVDMPCRLFRNDKGIQFFGKVHEHPEITMNEGLGAVSMMPFLSIVHHGYVDERVRRTRFSRNLPLLKQDREERPGRLLGKFLWLRDLAQSCQYDMEDGSADQGIMQQRADEGIKLWEELLEAKNWRLLIDSMPYYSQLVAIKGDGVDFSFMVDASLLHESDASKQPKVQGYFASRAHITSVLLGMAEDKIGDQERRYL